MLKSIGLAIVLALSASVASAAERSTTPPKGLDWSGVWQHVTGIVINASGAAEIPKPSPSDLPSLKPEYQKKFEEQMRAIRSGVALGDPGTDCKWPGVPSIIRTTMPQEFIVLPDRVMIVYEYMSQVRRIFTDGRKAPGPEDLEYSYNGFSTGYWEGDTLVVETVGLRADTTLPMGVPHTEQLKVVERYRETSPGLIEVEITMTDPGVLTAPWRQKSKYRRQAPDFPILEYSCTDNNRNGVSADGTTYTLDPSGKPL